MRPAGHLRGTRQAVKWIQTRGCATIAAWLHALHSGSAYWTPLRPDPLCDRLLANLDVLPDPTETLTDVASSSGDTYHSAGSSPSFRGGRSFGGSRVTSAPPRLGVNRIHL